MQHQISAITLGASSLEASRRFYVEGFGWSPVFANDEVLFYQMNGLMLTMWLREKLAEDGRRTLLAGPGGFAPAHNVGSREDIDAALAQLANVGGVILRRGDAPPHGGYRGYVAGPDSHAWEIAPNPAWSIDAEDHITFGI